MTSRIYYNNPNRQGALGLPYHYEMVSDNKRVNPFKRAIQRTCKGKIVLEIGSGSAIFSILATKAGAKKVYAIEIDPKVAHFSEENIRKSGYKKFIKFIQKDIREVSLKDLDNQKADIVISENLSTWQVTEPQIPIMNYVNKFLVKDNAIRIPTLIFNNVELAHSRYRFEDAIDFRTYYFEFTGINKPKILSKKILCTKVDLRILNSIESYNVVKIKVTKRGVLNSVRLTSRLQVHGDIMFDSSDSLLPPVILPLKRDILVEKNDIIKLTIKYKHNTKWEAFKCEAIRV